MRKTKRNLDADSESDRGWKLHAYECEAGIEKKLGGKLFDAWLAENVEPERHRTFNRISDYAEFVAAQCPCCFTGCYLRVEEKGRRRRPTEREMERIDDECDAAAKRMAETFDAELPKHDVIADFHFVKVESANVLGAVVHLVFPDDAAGRAVAGKLAQTTDPHSIGIGGGSLMVAAGIIKIGKDAWERRLTEKVQFKFDFKIGTCGSESERIEAWETLEKLAFGGKNDFESALGTALQNWIMKQEGSHAKVESSTAH